jgi:[ribosomal protein S18]-alanine N-acetyltransferase
MMISIRKAEKQDFLAIAALDRIVWRGYPDSQYIPDGEHVWRHWVEGALVICAFSDHTIAGAGCAFPCTNGTFCVHKIFVAEAYRNRKIGTQLLTALVEKIDTFGQDAFLTVHPGNKPALKLYTSLGFTHREFVKSYYRQEEDRFILTRRYRDQVNSTTKETCHR